MSDDGTYQGRNRRDLRALSNYPTDARERINSNLRRLETRLFMLAQHTEHRDIVFIDNPRSQIALQRMTTGEIEQLTSAAHASFVLSQPLSAITPALDLYCVKSGDIAHLVGGDMSGYETLVYDYLLTMRDLVIGSPSLSAAHVRTGLDADAIDDLESLSFDMLRSLSRRIVRQCSAGTPFFRLRYNSKLLTTAARDVRRFSQLKLAQTTTIRHS